MKVLQPSRTPDGVAAPPLPPYRLAFEQFQRMIDCGVFAIDDHCEYLHGCLVQTQVLTPPHATTIGLAKDAFRAVLPDEWLLRVRSHITTKDSQPRPDLVVVRGPLRSYCQHHPRPKETALIVEVADFITAPNKQYKQHLYAGAGIAEYWIVNLVERRLEVYRSPKRGRSAAYRDMTIFKRSDSVSVILAGSKVGSLAVRDLILAGI